MKSRPRPRRASRLRLASSTEFPHERRPAASDRSCDHSSMHPKLARRPRFFGRVASCCWAAGQVRTFVDFTRLVGPNAFVHQTFLKCRAPFVGESGGRPISPKAQFALCCHVLKLSLYPSGEGVENASGGKS